MSSIAAWIAIVERDRPIRADALHSVNHLAPCDQAAVSLVPTIASRHRPASGRSLIRVHCVRRQCAPDLVETRRPWQTCHQTLTANGLTAWP